MMSHVHSSNTTLHLPYWISKLGNVLYMIYIIVNGTHCRFILYEFYNAGTTCHSRDIIILRVAHFSEPDDSKTPKS